MTPTQQLLKIEENLKELCSSDDVKRYGILFNQTLSQVTKQVIQLKNDSILFDQLPY